MSEKAKEAMKKILEKRKEKEIEHQKYRPDKKLGHAQSSKKNQKPGGSNNKV
ncbi:MAG: hypothetical protein IBX70_10085 [Clostridia bacterium]|nr:hypothetical protein [Clostridia bacterium]